ncbi:MAG: hypothetical protein IPH93_17495 [Saprospiraceae bacterium]|nr:hypothetical protein [Saprospiraceae bacterium]
MAINGSIDKIIIMSSEADNKRSRIEANLILVTLIVMKLETTINELINSVCEWKPEMFDQNFIDNFVQNEKTMCISEKYNLLANKLNALEWKLDKEPFQTFDVLISIRNEMVHYKGKWIEQNKGPNKKITHLMNNIIKIKSQDNNLKHTHWVNELLGSENLLNWCKNVDLEIDNFLNNNILDKFKSNTLT